MDTASKQTIVHDDAGTKDDMEQVRQLILGDHAARQVQQIEVLERRVARLEQLLRAIVSHSESAQRTWEVEVASLLGGHASNGTENATDSRGISHDVTPLSPGLKQDD